MLKRGNSKQRRKDAILKIVFKKLQHTRNSLSGEIARDGNKQSKKEGKQYG